jgi:hypothetical protein
MRGFCSGGQEPGSGELSNRIRDVLAKVDTGLDLVLFR